MRDAEVSIGKVYAVKVSERIVPVRLTGTASASYGGRPRYTGHNMKTGRDITLSAARCRFEIVRSESCGHWLRTDRDADAHHAQYHADADASRAARGLPPMHGGSWA